MVRSLRTLAVAATVGTFAMGGVYAQSTTGTTQQQPQSNTQSQPQGKADDAAARQALLEAREALAELSKSPEAAQLQGQARTEVAEVITNFNALLSAESDWYDQYRAVMQNLHNVLGPVSAARTSGSTSATGTSGTAAAGTAGEVPSALRDKLVEFRQKLMEFGRVAGAPDVTGGVAASGAAGSSGAAGTTGTSGTAAPSTTGAAASDTVEHHLDAIGDIIQEALSGQAAAGTTGTTGTAGTTAAAGTVTIDRAKLDSIQSHLQRIREIARTKGIR